ncbi:methionine gamma-lyase family protein [Loigolactobacillus coryniformis]|uniref:Aluminum resistance protein n=2 Tax=Loigolactobacillus coryniformis TaxID=1610 RepID=A0A0R1F5H8_9LACO|nr:methionine gamma-lyase family protein [Loigolactobacillus coryniformis]ATO44009.1 aluminum resistance protein [Loigolactobacillus coryniformis subsp. torquens DSM 20004 = KCTC 3535]ATO55684.1 aluminum resistance protein [Loigolactobacillus coryniformis subsp. coryniformis KCTC 3167 = DSM 20001]KRK14881.1 aluminum resistance protein [Loigolactobacillus coryniformis subsp. coryniformis KCTC 3167 = DSM 20001]KRK83860.1 aluminum resistance protein [Loigolactobacillus coryniformis subsp. torquens
MEENWQQIDPKLAALVTQVDQQIQPELAKISARVLYNQHKVLRAFRDQRVATASFAGTTGYGYDDEGRDQLDAVYAQAFGGEAAIVRPQFVSGTHAIGTAFFGLLRPGDELLYLTGMPYDTLQEVIGVAGDGVGSLKEFGIGFDYVPLTAAGKVATDQIAAHLKPQTKVVAIQRSRGYASRDSFTVAEIAAMIKAVRQLAPEVTIFVDNCYGEFSETQEPLSVGADLMAGSLIKNPGGGLAKTGGYIAGRRDLVEKVGYALTVPGIGAEEAATLNNLSDMFQGFFLAPHVVGEAIKGAIFTAALLAQLNLDVQPTWQAPRTDLIQTVNFGNADAMVTFAKAIQQFSPIDAFVAPIPSEMAGYEDPIIMAAGTFVQGASVELSADGPLRPPYTLYIQGGLTFEHVKLAITAAANSVFFAEK